MKILYAASGTGTGTLAKGLALRKAAARNFPNIEIGLALGTDFPELIPASNSYTKTWSNREGNLTGRFTDAVKEFEPDKVIICYNGWQVTEELAKLDVEAHLLWRAMKNSKQLVDRMDLTRYKTIQMFEDPMWEYLQTVATAKDKIQKIAPFYQAYEDELIQPQYARAQLLDSWDVKDQGLPIRVFAHNGASQSEVDAFLKEAFIKDGQGKFHDLFLSQYHDTNGRRLLRPLVFYMKAIDRLVACAGPTVFYEWFRFKKPEATERFMMASRLYDPQDWRATVDPKTILWYNGANGADMLLENLTNAS